MLEAVLADCIPIVSTDNEWTREFGMSELACGPDIYSMTDKINNVEANRLEYLHKIDKLKDNIKKKV